MDDSKPLSSDQPPPSKSARRARKDQGKLRDVDRDIPLLLFLAEHRAVNLEIIQVLRNCKQDSAEDWAKDRMAALKYVKLSKGPFLGNIVTYVWLIKSGVTRVGLDYTGAEPKQLEHSCAVAYIRLYLQSPESALTKPENWISERQLRSQIAHDGNDHSGIHVPDGVYLNMAIECEMTAKHPQNTADIMQALLKQYDEVLYVTSKAAYNKVQRAISFVSKQLPQAAPRINIILLDDVIAEVQKRYRGAMANVSPSKRKIKTKSSFQHGSEDTNIIFQHINQVLNILARHHNYDDAFMLIEHMISLAVFSQCQCWMLTMIHIYFLLELPDEQKAHELFQSLVETMPLSSEERNVMQTMSPGRFFSMIQQRALSDDKGQLPPIEASYTTAQLSALLGFVKILSWNGAKANLQANIAALCEEQNELNLACRLYHHRLIQTDSNITDDLTDVYVALGRVYEQFGEHYRAYQYYEQAISYMRQRSPTELYLFLLEKSTRFYQSVQDGATALRYSKERNQAMIYFLHQDT